MRSTMLALPAPETAPSVSLLANLFTSCGKLAVRITSMGDDRATVCAPKRPAISSFAYLVRNGVKVPTTVAWREGDVVGLRFEGTFAGPWKESTFKRA